MSPLLVNNLLRYGGLDISIASNYLVETNDTSFDSRSVQILDVKREFEKISEKFDEGINQLSEIVSSSQISDDEASIINSISESVQDLSVTQNKYKEELSSLAKRLPDSFQDITQIEIRRRLSILEDRLNYSEILRSAREGIKLERWQVVLGVLALLVPYIILLVQYLIEK